MQGVDPNKFAAYNVLEDNELRQGASLSSSRIIFSEGFLTRRCFPGLKEYSDWPTIPQLYVNKEFVGGCDIMISMHQNGELSKLLEEKGVLAFAETKTEEEGTKS